jgi:hypothetical protein
VPHDKQCFHGICAFTGRARGASEILPGGSPLNGGETQAYSTMTTDRTPIDALPAESRLWIYPLDRALRDDERSELHARLGAFVAGWTSHGRPISAAYALLYDRFVLIAGLIPGGDVSGCGIDASVRMLQEAGHRLGFGVAGGLDIFFRGADDQILHLPRPQFRKLAREGAITGNTVVFDTSLTHLGDFQAGRFEQPAGASWHATVFQLAPRSA